MDKQIFEMIDCKAGEKCVVTPSTNDCATIDVIGADGDPIFRLNVFAWSTGGGNVDVIPLAPGANAVVKSWSAGGLTLKAEIEVGRLVSVDVKAR